MSRLSLLMAGLLALGIGSQARAALIHAYTFNDGTPNDSVGTANGTLASHATIANGQLTTDGTDQNTAGGAVGVTLPASTFSGITGDFTIEQFVTDVAANSQFSTTFSIGNDTNDFVLLNPSRNGGNVTADFKQGSANTEVNIAGPAPLAKGVQHQVAITYTAMNNTATLYVDGVSVGSGSLDKATGTGNTLNLSTLAGAFNGINDHSPFTGDHSLNGSTNEFRIYDNALSAADVATSFLNGPPPVIPEPATLGLLGVGAVGLLARRRRAA